MSTLHTRLNKEFDLYHRLFKITSVNYSSKSIAISVHFLDAIGGTEDFIIRKGN